MSADTLWIVSDGGLDLDQGYYGWVIADATQIIYEGSGKTPGNSTQLDSLRSETFGMFHALTVMTYLITHTNFNNHIILASDNMELIKRTKHIYEYGSRLPSQTTLPHMDVQLEIDELILTYFTDLDIVHVKGHQDTHKGTNL